MADRKKHHEEKSTPKALPAQEVADAPLSLPLKWEDGPNVISRYANQATVQFGAHECRVSFFEVHPPILLGSVEEIQEQAKNLKSVKAECVGRIIVSNEFLPVLTKVLQDALEKRQAASASEYKDQGDNGKKKAT